MSSEWKFKDPKDRRVYTLRQIMEGHAPILYVSHDSDDGAWQFLGGEPPKVEDGMSVCLEHIVERDPSIEALADLNLGWHAWRESLMDPWVMETNSYDPDRDGAASS